MISPRNFKAQQKGFTLLEVMVATMILAGGIMVIALSWSGNVNRLAKSRLSNTLSFLLQREMVELEARYKDKIGELPEDDGKPFDDFPSYSWKMTSRDFEMPDLSSALIAREGGADDVLLTIVRTIADYIKQAVKEVTVIVAYKPPGASKEITAQATTYYVDYSKDISMNIPGGAGAAGTTPAAGTTSTTPTTSTTGH